MNESLIQWNLTQYEMGVLIRAIKVHAKMSTGLEFDMAEELYLEALELVAENKRLTADS